MKQGLGTLDRSQRAHFTFLHLLRPLHVSGSLHLDLAWYDVHHMLGIVICVLINSNLKYGVIVLGLFCLLEKLQTLILAFQHLLMIRTHYTNGTATFANFYCFLTPALIHHQSPFGVSVGDMPFQYQHFVFSILLTESLMS